MPNQNISRFSTESDPYELHQYEHEEENWTALVDNWDTFRDHLILFLGAGASIGARTILGPFPDAYDLRNGFYSMYIAPEIDPDNVDFGGLGLMSLEMADTLPSTRVGQDNVKNYVARHFLVDKPLWQHSVLGFLKPHAVFTTNYDNLVELGWPRAQGEMPIGSLKEVFQSNVSLLQGVVPFYKPHGSAGFATMPIGQGGIVLTQSDYFKMLNQQPEMLRQFMDAFGQSCVIFVGYSFNDLDIAACLYDIHQNSSGKPPWFAVFPRYDLAVRQRLNKEFGIIHIARHFLDFLVELDKKVNFIPTNWKFSNLADLIRNCGLQPAISTRTTAAP
jgi:hypothetical protein